MRAKSPERIAAELGIRERNVKKIIRMEKEKKAPIAANLDTEPCVASRPVSIKKTIILASVALIIILGFAVYANSLNGKFVYDDNVLIKNNSFLKNEHSLSKFFLEDIGKGGGRRYNFYRPIQIISYALDYRIWKLNVIGYHFTNIILHILVAISIYWLVTILFGNKTLSVLVAVLFVVHPIHTIVVSYISTRADLLYLLFLLLSFIFYTKYNNTESPTHFLIMISSYLLSLFSKENALILPALLLLYHYTFRKKVGMIGFLSISGTALFYVFFRITVLKHLLSNGAGKGTLFQRVPGFFTSITTYIQLIFLPFNLHMEYGKRLFNFSNPKAIIGLVILISIVFCIFRALRKNRLIFFSLSWFLITLLPISNLYPINAYMSENWLYLPSIGIFLVLGEALGLLYKTYKFRAAVFIFTLCLLVFYSYLTIKQNETWRDPVIFYKRILKYAPESLSAYYNLGSTYLERGNKEEAAEMFKKALELKSDKAWASNDPDTTYYYLGNMYYGMGRLEEAADMLKKTIEINPDYAEAYNNLGLICYKMGKKEDAFALYKKAIELSPDYADAYNNLGIVDFEIGKQEDSIAAFKRALQINPDRADTRRNLDVISNKPK